ncbi:FtsX-like permease family protein [Luteimonas sp. FCS-9]|uniref:ABC transporter permease n=1 Tax=Luteimonas sp. FCS-9 TaxID=1547516 RepID=UPI00063EA620|nr:FtsX-like permease family protein [Luteimonas sp. FCS-9]KLI97927.1 ABC transporter permease [Luteimonas sp. FCS-9]
MHIRPIVSSLHRHRITAALIVLEIALTCAIVCNALFLIGGRVDAVRRPSGIAERELLQIRLSGIGPQADAGARTREDLAALRAVPGVAAATVTNQLPFYRFSSSNSGLSLTADQVQPTLDAARYYADESTIATLGIRLVAGRDFLPDEYMDVAEVEALEGREDTLRGATIVTASVARRMFPGQDAVGRTVYLGPAPLTIVGVAETLARPSASNGEDTFSFLVPIRLHYNNGGNYVVRVTEPARRDEVLAAAVAALESVDASRLILFQSTYEDIRDGFFRNDREMIGLLSTVSIALLVVTAFGIVGLASFWVQQRTRQIGVRRALGATRMQILRHFQTENFLLTSAGIVLGMGLAYALNQLMMSRYELPRLPLAYLPVGALLLWTLGQAAVLWPARRAAAVSPAIATRAA